MKKSRKDGCIDITDEKIRKLKIDLKPKDWRDKKIVGFVLRVQPSGLKTYSYVYKNIAGRKRCYKIGRHGDLCAADARKIAVEKAGEVAKGIDIQAERQKQRDDAQKLKNSTLQKFLDGARYNQSMKHRPNGEIYHQSIMAGFPDFMKLPLSKITVDRMEQWQMEQEKRGLRPSSINRMASSLRTALNMAVKWGAIEHNPLNGLKPLKMVDNSITRYLTPDETTRLMDALHRRETRMRVERSNYNRWLMERGKEPFPEIPDTHYADYLMPVILLALHTGIRRKELFTLEWQHVNWDKRILTVLGCNAKSDKTRHIPLNDTVFTALSRWRKQTTSNHLVFPNMDGEVMHDTNTSWGNLKKSANIENFRWHDMRHDFASQLVMRGVSILSVSKLMGHSDIKMTMRYAHLAPDYLAAEIKKLDKAA